MQYDFLFALPLANLPFLLSGALLSLKMAAVAAIGGLLIAVVTNYVYFARPGWLVGFATSYVELARNTPLLVQLFLAYFGLPSLGINMNAETTALIVLTLNNGAYMAEILRGGMAGLGRGLTEAGLSLGMSRWQAFYHVLLPPALANVAPALANQFIALTLATSLASQIAAEELTYRATLLEARIFHSFEIYFITLVIYFVLAQVLHQSLKLALRFVARGSGGASMPGYT